MSLCHLYFEEIKSLHVEILKTSFDGISLDINDVDTLMDYEVYIIELEFATKEISLKLRHLFKEKQNPLIYFIISSKYNLMLFQLTYLLGTKDVITPGQKTDKIISKIESDLQIYNTLEVLDEKVVCEAVESISSRITFINVLEEELKKEQIYLNAITINISNIDKIQGDLGLIALEEYLNETIIYMESLFEERLLFSQYDRDFYIVLLEDTEFEDVKDMANEFHNLVLESIEHKEFKFMIDVFSLDLNAKTVGEVISELYSVKNKELTYSQMHSKSIEYTSQTQTIITEKGVINDAFVNNISFKLLNIYNGLVITTPSKILKIVDNTIYVNFEQLQGVVMKMNKETILQSSVFLQDILAKIKVIDFQKKIAVLENFKFLKTDVNSRKYARVTTSSKIQITLTHNFVPINGNILDLSIKSIAIKTKYSKKINLIKNEVVSISFNIPNYRFDEGYTQLRLNAKVIVVLPLDSDENCKIVCDFEDGFNDESTIKEYVYDRQRELIIEIKKMSKLN